MKAAQNKDPRQAVLKALDLCLEKGLPAQRALDRILEKSQLEPRDAGLCTEIFYGYLRLKGRIEFILGRMVKKWGKQRKKLRRCTELAFFEILYLDRVPDYASVNWAVSQIKPWAGARLGGLVNAVLRRACREREQYTLNWFEAESKTNKDAWSAFFSVPLWIVELWIKSYGKEATLFYLQAGLHKAPVGLLDMSRVQRGADSDLPEGRSVSEIGRSDREKIDRGEMALQSLSAQNAMAALKAQDWAEPVWDACAGRGGKTLWLHAAGKNGIWSSDLSMGRLKRLADHKFLKTPAPLMFRASALLPPLKQDARTILLDVPCSGLGVMSRNPDLKWKRNLRDLDELQNVQRRMLQVCFEKLPLNGKLAYMTCTLNPSENEKQIEWLLKERNDAELEIEWQTSARGSNCEFFYAALIQKISGE